MVAKFANTTAFSLPAIIHTVIRRPATPTTTTSAILRTLRIASSQGPYTVAVRRKHYRPVLPSYGVFTPVPENYDRFPIFKSPFRFETGYALRAKRPSRPFPPPFLSPPSSSFSDPLTTHYKSLDRRPLSVKGELIRGLNNGDDAILAAENFIGVNDGVGAWATRPRGHAA